MEQEDYVTSHASVSQDGPDQTAPMRLTNVLITYAIKKVDNIQKRYFKLKHYSQVYLDEVPQHKYVSQISNFAQIFVKIACKVRRNFKFKF